MAKGSKKTLLIPVSTPTEIETVVNFAKRKSKGLRLIINYEHTKGLTFRVSGPRDRIMLFEVQVLEFVKHLDEFLSE